MPAPVVLVVDCAWNAYIMHGMKALITFSVANGRGPGYTVFTFNCAANLPDEVPGIWSNNRSTDQILFDELRQLFPEKCIDIVTLHIL